MNRKKFLDILTHYQNISEEDIPKLQELEKEYPYSQIIHGLVAKASHDAGYSDAKASLNKAAIYTTDRSVLKNLIENKIPEPIADYPLEALISAAPESTVEEKRPSTPPPENVQTSIGQVTPLSQSESDQLREEVMKNLAKIKESKKNYKAIFFNGGSNDTAEPSKSAKVKKDEKQHKEKKKLKTGNFIEQLAQDAATESAPNTSLIREQSQIIDKFIAAVPSIERKIVSPDPSSGQEDLAEQSSEFGEGLVSETLANIFIKQGKKEKAKDIYKKLIWKFPQKKAYFASLIENLND